MPLIPIATFEELDIWLESEIAQAEKSKGLARAMPEKGFYNGYVQALLKLQVKLRQVRLAASSGHQAI